MWKETGSGISAAMSAYLALADGIRERAMSQVIMVVDDDSSVVRLVEFILQRDGFQVAAFPDGQSALEALDAVKPALMIVDWMMPRLDGVELAKRVRELRDYQKIPILFLTAKSQMADKYDAFSVGADDFIVKPFDPLELLFRVRAFLRLVADELQDDESRITVGDLVLEPARYAVVVGNDEIALTKLETSVLRFLIEHRDEIVSAEQLASKVLGDGEGRSVDAAHAHIRHLRRKIEVDPARPRRLVTVGRKGYRFFG